MYKCVRHLLWESQEGSQFPSSSSLHHRTWDNLQFVVISLRLSFLVGTLQQPVLHWKGLPKMRWFRQHKEFSCGVLHFFRKYYRTMELHVIFVSLSFIELMHSLERSKFVESLNIRKSRALVFFSPWIFPCLYFCESYKARIDKHLKITCHMWLVLSAQMM